MRQLVILAGGKGTRLRERLGALPKPLIDVCGVPLLERQVLLAKRHGFEQVLLLVNYQAESIIDFCRKKNNWGLDIQCINDGEPCGTAGAVVQAINHLADEFLLMYGDTMLGVDLQRFHEYHATDSTVAATLFLHPNDHPQDSDLVAIDERGYIRGFYPYPHDPNQYYPNLVNAALYWIRKSALEPWRGFSSGILDFGKHLFPAMIKNGSLLRGYNSPEYVKDCGTPTRIDKVCADFLAGKIARSALDHEQKAVFVDRDGTLNYEVDHLTSIDQFALLPGVESAIRRLNESELRVCVATNQPVIARGECSPEELRKIHNKLETLLGRQGAFVDRIYYCPHHPDKGFSGEIPEYKMECGCRKPKTGMIDAAVSDLNIARSQSWLIGDTTADMLAARGAGLKSIMVETGHGGLDEKYWALPDFIVPDLEAAVAFILDIYPALLRTIEPLTNDIRPGAVVFVGGQSRSGKSSFSSALREVLAAKGLRAHLLSTDRWLLNEAARGKGVLGRHDVARLQDVLSAIYKSDARPIQLSLPRYRKLSRDNVPDAEKLVVAHKDIVIVEGVVALHYAEILRAKHKFFVQLEEPLRKLRVIKEYTMRGFTNAAADAIYRERLADEFQWVDATAKSATRVSISTS